MSEADCIAVRPLLPRIADGEADPAEAMTVARHLHDCTACRILLARERRLASILEEELEDWLLVGEDFLRDVMANLPQEPPPRSLSDKGRRTLKLAGFIALLASLQTLATRGADLAAARVPTLTLPRFETAGTDGGFESVLGLSRLLLAVAEFLGRLLPTVELSPIGLGSLAALALIATAACGVGGTTVLALASHRISRLIR